MVDTSYRKRTHGYANDVSSRNCFYVEWDDSKKVWENLNLFSEIRFPRTSNRSGDANFPGYIISQNGQIRSILINRMNKNPNNFPRYGNLVT
jgi:hypothetical protein